MKVVILAGGFGTRILEESITRPKPMVEIGGIPILIHLMRNFYKQGFNDFIICTGYKGYFIKEYFSNYFFHNSDITFDMTSKEKIIIHNSYNEKWKVTVIDTGLNTQTGGRIKQIKNYINDDFIMTYGDGLSNINLKELVKVHSNSNNIATITAIQPGNKYGKLEINKNSQIIDFFEKNKNDGGWINGGLICMSKEIFSYIDGDTTSFEFDTLPKISNINKLGSYKHYGFWHCMDSLKDRNDLEELWNSGIAPWVI